MHFLSADYGVIPNRRGGKFPAWEHLAAVPGSGRGDGWSGGWRQHTLHVVWVTSLGMGSAKEPQVWDLGPRSSSVWYNPTALQTNQPFYSKETQLVQNLKKKKASYLPCAGQCKGTKLSFSIYVALIIERLRVLQPLLQSSS